MTSNDTRAEVLVTELMEAEDLRLRLVTGPEDLDCLAVQWTSATELIDPSRFLEGNELMLITGEELNADDPEAIREYITRLAARGIRAIGFGVGLRHAIVPSHLVSECASMGVALLEVPRGIPFGAISRFVADEVASKEYSAVRHTMGVHDRLVKALTDGSGLPAMVGALSEITGSDCCIVDFYGTLLAESPVHAIFPIDAVLDRRDAIEEWFVDGTRVHPILLRGGPVATLLTRAAPQHDEAVAHAVGLIALEFAHRSELQVIRREAIGTVLGDFLAGALTDAKAVKELSRYGLSIESPNTVLVVRAHRSSDAMLTSPWNLQAELVGRHDPKVLVASVQRDLVVIVSDREAVEGAAPYLADRLRPVVGPVAIGVGNAYTGIGGLRLSHSEASAAAAGDAGVHSAGRPHLADLMVATSQPGINELAGRILGPLTDHDDETGGDLLETLTVLLQEGGSSGRTAERLFLHRNTIGQRIQKIKRLTGLDPNRLPDATELWLALAFRHGSPSPDG